MDSFPFVCRVRDWLRLRLGYALVIERAWSDDDLIDRFEILVVVPLLQLRKIVFLRLFCNLRPLSADVVVAGAVLLTDMNQL